MQEITFTINGIPVTGQLGNTILEVAQKYGVSIPTLCHDRHLHPYGACRICLVEDKNRGTLIPACITQAAEGMDILTDSPVVLDTRVVIVKLLIASHPDSCIVCEKGNRCALRQVAADLGIGLVDYYPMPRYTGTQEVNSFLLRDLSKCILCAKCIRADHELVVEGAIDYLERGFDARPATVHNEPLERSACTFCGTCMELCPTGALFERGKLRAATSSQRITTTCPFCACGCVFDLETADDCVVGARPGILDSPNGVTLCVKGHFGYDFANHPQRLHKPLLRTPDGLVDTSWENAIAVAAHGFQNLIEQYGSDSIAILCSPHCTNEEAFLLRSLSSHILKINNLSCNAGMDMRVLLDGMREPLGFAGSRHTFQDIETANAFLVIGTNPPESAPVLGYALKRAIRKSGAHLVVIDPIENKLSRQAAVWLQPKPATDELVLLSLLGAVLQELLGKKTVPPQLRAHLKEISKQCQNLSAVDVERVTGIPFERIRQAAQLFEKADKKAIVFGTGIFQQPRGTELVQIIGTMGHLVELLTGTEVILFPVLKQSNAAGCVHLGLFDTKTPEQIFQEILAGHIKGLWIIEDDPVVNVPGAGQVCAALDKLAMLVVSDSFLSRSAQKAHVVLPVATFAENAGSVTNMENRVQFIRPAINAVGESLPGWLVISKLANKLGADFNFRSSEEIFAAIRHQIPAYAPIRLPEKNAAYSSYRLAAPVTAAKRAPHLPHTGVPEYLADEEYPYVLVLGSILFQLDMGYKTAHCRRLATITADEYVELNKEDALRMNISDQEWIRLVSPAGAKVIKSRCSARILQGTVFLPLPFARGSTLLPFSAPGSGFKNIKVRIEKVSA